MTKICELCKRPWNRCQGHGRLTTAVTIETVPCELCEAPTPMTATKLCDRCWELYKRISANVELSRKILQDIDDKEFA